MNRQARSNVRAFRGMTLSLAMALAAAGGLAMTIPSGDANAMQRSKKGKEEKAPAMELSNEFRTGYGEVAKLIEASDFPAAQARIDQLAAASTTPDEKFLSGNLYLQLGGKTKDTALQRKGLKLALESGKTPAADIGRFNYFAGSFAYEAKDYAEARQYFKAAVDSGYTENQIGALYAESYFQDDMAQQGLAALNQAIEAEKAAGRTVPENWYRRAAAVALSKKLPSETSEWFRKLVVAYPSATNWRDALIVFRDSASYEAQANLDVMRLMREADVLTDLPMYKEYVENAGAGRLPGEVIAVIDEGRARNVIPAADAYLDEQYSMAKDRVSGDRSSLPDAERDGMKASTGTTALATADAYLGYDQNEKAAMLYKAAIEKGGIDKDRALTRLGIAETRLGNYDAAKQAFSQVTGVRKPLADYWTLWIDGETSASAAAPATAAEETAAAEPTT